MHRVHPKEMLAIPPEDASKLRDLRVEEGERKLVTEFSWSLAIALLEQKMEKRVGRGDIYYLDGHLILDESFLESVTEEICQEYGLDLLDVIADLVLPIGFGYSSLLGSLPELVDDAFKPISKLGQPKVVLWVEDEHWNNPEKSILTLLLRDLLLSNMEPYLIAPDKYFDKEVMTVFSRRMFDARRDSSSGEMDAENQTNQSAEDDWKSFGIFIKLGFLLALRASLHCRLIILHFGQRFSDMIDAFQLLDLAEAEGHKIKYLKNTGSNHTERKQIVDQFLTSLKDMPNMLTSRSKESRFRSRSQSNENRNLSSISSDSGASVVTTEEMQMMDVDVETNLDESTTYSE